MDSDYHNLGDTTLNVWNRNCVKTSMEHLQLYLVGHSQLMTATSSPTLHGSLGVVTLRVRNRNHLRKSTSYLQLYLGGRSQVSACDDQLLVINTHSIIWS